jgi:uncharacterized membrane-anchored protein YjiN (DUF445 family)
MMLEGLTRDNRHQKLLDSLINQLIALLQRDSSRAFIARGIIHWLQTEHPLRPNCCLPNGSANTARKWSPMRSIRCSTKSPRIAPSDPPGVRSRGTLKLIDNLKTDPLLAEKADNIKAYLKNDEAFNRYLSEVWADLRGVDQNDVTRDDSHSTADCRCRAVVWRNAAPRCALRESLNEHLEQAAHRVAPEFAAFLTRHISDTVKSWDARDMSRQIELNIGKDLQFIRINGTLVGGSIGLYCGCSRRSRRCCFCIKRAQNSGPAARRGPVFSRCG